MKVIAIKNYGQSINWMLFPYEIKRKDGAMLQAAVISYRRSRLKGYKYIDIRICHYIFISIHLSKV